MNLSLDETKNTNDIVVESEAMDVVFDSELEAYVRGAVIDYSDAWYKRGFSIRGGGMSSC